MQVVQSGSTSFSPVFDWSGRFCIDRSLLSSRERWCRDSSRWTSTDCQTSPIHSKLLVSAGNSGHTACQRNHQRSTANRPRPHCSTLIRFRTFQVDGMDGNQWGGTPRLKPRFRLNRWWSCGPNAWSLKRRNGRQSRTDRIRIWIVSDSSLKH